ncbi:glycosyltransferase family 2 protein [Parapedobacter indicus]|uniref:Glycosyltransferase involved in cell wall bisynthesis n=1 Tax=Parapedobacter indicus TaxID=1477437 RepID=A0A1I3KZ64_9SPHI|nr:glycosyltransferase family 2 protein [Parapedobacter indicus]PPL01967.1 glycosyltransferase involved in cell wall biosynthesis [Parapedobacter indicus]SFI77747.1 Glycosyltransferase involved in cell wall bisynthesis [Parapedobacter indicus]
MSTSTLTIITVVYNNVRDIERTIKSVICQTYPYIEYLIIDGNSTDGTVDVIKRYGEHISEWISEPDKGIYDAMNKGLGRATGDYVLFMNSGDEIYAEDTVAQVFASAPDADIYYGETEMYDADWQSIGLRRHAIPPQFNWRSFRFGMNISHQAIYIRRSIAGRYDLRYQLSADIDWIIRAAKKANKVVNTRRLVAKYLVGGMSKKRHWQSLKERFCIFTKHYGLLPNIVNHLIIAINLAIYYIRHGKSND